MLLLDVRLEAEISVEILLQKDAISSDVVVIADEMYLQNIYLQYMDCNSYAPASHKINVVNSLVNRALKICSEDEMENEMKYIKQNLKMNGFPKKTVEKQISKLKRKHSSGNFGTRKS